MPTAPSLPSGLTTINTDYVYAFVLDSETYYFPLYAPHITEYNGETVVSVEAPGVAGAYVAQAEVLPGVLTVDRRFMIVASSAADWQAQTTEIARKTRGRGYLWKVRPDGSCLWTPAYRKQKPRYSITAETAHAKIADVILNFMCPAGLWFTDKYAPPLYGEGHVYGTGLIYGTDAGKTYYALSGAAGSFTVYNRGTAVARAVLLTCEAQGANGVQTSLTVTNATTGHTFTIGDGLASAGQQFEVNTEQPRVRKYTGSWASAWASFTQGTTQRGIFALAPGANTVNWSVGAGAANFALNIKFYEPYH